MDVARIKQDIKSWEHAFFEQNKRQPSKNDIKSNQEIHKLYSLYKSVKQGKSTSNNHLKSPPPTKKKSIDASSSPMSNVFGPTPQANGRVLSIFDLKMTPHESSPLKRKSNDLARPICNQMKQMNPPESPVKRILATPTKPKSAINFSTPSKTMENFSAETPRYLKGVVTPSNQKVVETDFQVSPSPFKLIRPIGKKLIEVYNASLEDFEKNDEFDNQENEEHDEEHAVSDAQKSDDKKYKKARTQKRSTRRSKIAPRPVEESATIDPIDLKEKIIQLDTKKREEFQAYINSDEEYESDFRIESNADSPIKKTRKPVTENYKRMKINDPRTKRFKQRMRR